MVLDMKLLPISVKAVRQWFKTWWLLLAIAGVFAVAVFAGATYGQDAKQFFWWVFENDVKARNLGLIATGIIGIGLLVWRSVLADKQVKLSEKSQHIDLYQKGAAMLGDTRMSVRQAGIFALQQLAETDPENYFRTVQNLLCSFVRDRSSEQRLEMRQSGELEATKEAGMNEAPGGNGKETAETLPPIAEDSQTTMETISALQSSDKIPEHLRRDHTLRLANANLTSTTLFDVDLSGANLRGANLRGADLFRVNLFRVNMEGADLTGARLAMADLRRADLRGAKLEGADLEGVDLEGANWEGADLRSANLFGANLCRLYNAARINDAGDIVIKDWLKAVLKPTLNLDMAFTPDKLQVSGSNDEGWEISYRTPETDGQ